MDISDLELADIQEFNPDAYLLPEDLEEPGPSARNYQINPIHYRLSEQVSELDSLLINKQDEIHRLAHSNSEVYTSIKNDVLYGRNEPPAQSSGSASVFRENVIRKPILEVQDVWKRFLNTEWIIGVILESNTETIIRNMRIDMKMNNQPTQGRSCFWRLKNYSHWQSVDLILAEENTFTATFSFDISDFNTELENQLIGIVSYEAADQNLQVPLPIISLTVQETFKNCISNFTDSTHFVDCLNTVLAIKSISIEKVISIRFDRSSTPFSGFSKFLFENSFKNIRESVFIHKKQGALMHSYVELFTRNKNGVIEMILGARSQVQLDILQKFLREKYDIMPDSSKEIICRKAAYALLDEMKLYINTSNERDIQRAQMKSNVLIP